MKSSYVFLNGIRLHYLHWGLENGGSPVVLLHGLSSNARIWEFTAPLLANRGFSIFALDARGHGLTDKPDGDYSFETMHRDLGAFLQACHLERPILVGHSWGANIALDYASRILLGPNSSSGIVLVDGGFVQLDDSPGATWESIRERLSPPRLAGTSVEEFIKLLASINRDWHPTEEVISIILANFEILEDETIYPRLTFEHHMQIVRAMWEFHSYGCYPRLNCPVLALPARPAEPVNEREQEFLEQKERGLKRISQLNPSIEVHWMQDSIHDIPLQRPEELAELIAKFAISSINARQARI